MPSKPGFLLQDAWDAAATWARTVGEMGRAEGPQRIGARAYNRRRPLRAKSARPRMKAESPGGAPKGPRREEGRITRRGDRSAETTGACTEQRAMSSPRASGAPQFDVPCEGGSRASLEAKKRAAAPETMNSAADMVLDSAAEEGRQHCNQARPVARPEAKREAASNSGRAARSFGKQAAALGNAAPAPKPPKAFANDAGIIKATDRDPRLPAWASRAGRVAKRMRTGSAWAQRMSIMRRLDEFATAHGPEMSRGNAPLFIVSLKPARSSAVQRTRAPLSPMAAGEAPAQMLPSGLRGAAAENPTRRTPPMMRREPHLVCNAMGSERGRVAVRLAWVTAGRCDEIALLRKKEFIGHPSDRDALVVDWGALPKTLEAGTRRAARCVAIAGADAAAMGRLIAKTVAWERLAALGARALEKALRPCAATAYSTKPDAPVHAAAATVERDLGPRAPTQLGKRAGPPGLPCGTARCPGHWAAVLNSSAKLAALMRRARRAWSNCLVRPQGPRAKAGCQCRFLMAAALWGALGYQSGRRGGTMAIAVAAAKAPPQQQGPAALRRGVAQCASVDGAASVKPRHEFENWRARRQRNGQGRCRSRSGANNLRRARRVPFATVEGKPAWLRSRFVALPKGKNDHGDCEAEALLRRPARALLLSEGSAP
ncbi:hypothetical protein ERJ75_000068600 [Trypanosoma vivax]|nr:hypothetical protein ERJ75_000068600 [Trypanosoma vivax]